MKVKIAVLGAIAFCMVSTGLAGKDKERTGKEYRWIIVDGPYACISKDDLRQITEHNTGDTELQMIDQLRAYYLISGLIVKLVQEDSASGMSQIHLAGITKDLWTLTKFLSKRPIKDPYGVIETPESSGLNTLEPNATPGPSVSPEPSVSPLPTSSPEQRATSEKPS
jgi:hypothetical protein